MNGFTIYGIFTPYNKLAPLFLLKFYNYIELVLYKKVPLILLPSADI